MRYSHLLVLSQHDVIRGSVELSVVPKLKPVHLTPNNFQSMKVKLKVQVSNYNTYYNDLKN